MSPFAVVAKGLLGKAAQGERLAMVAAALLLAAGVAVSVAGRRPPPPSLRLAADAAYGADPLQRVDVYGEPGLRAAPVVIFLHGGAYAFGDKNQPGGLWGNVAVTLARAGFVAVNADYRLLPRATWPAGIEDVRSLVAWARANADRFGGDPDRIVLVGHSAGATHVAGYLFDRSAELEGRPGVAGAVLVSGRYTLDPAPGDPNGRQVVRYFGADRAAWPERAPIAHLATAVPVRLLVVVAGHENPGLARSAAALVGGLCARGQCPSFLRLAGEDHVSEMANVGTADRALSDPLIGFVRGLRGR